MRSLDHQGPAAPQCRADSRRQPSAGPSRCSPPTSPTQYLAKTASAFHAKRPSPPRRSLLRQPGGFEGRFAVGERLSPDHFPITQIEQVRAPVVDLDPAILTPDPFVVHDHHLDTSAD